MIELLKYTYMMEPEKVSAELERLWNKYYGIICKNDPDWEEMNEARAILYLTGQVFCEQIAVEAMERRLHLLKRQLTLAEFLSLIDRESPELADLRHDEMLDKLERFYRVIKDYKNRYQGGKYYLKEELFLKAYAKANPNPELKVGYQGSFEKKSRTKSK